MAPVVSFGEIRDTFVPISTLPSLIVQMVLLGQMRAKFVPKKRLCDKLFGIEGVELHFST